MKNLDEMRARAEGVLSGFHSHVGHFNCAHCDLARAVLELLPVCERAGEQAHEAEEMGKDYLRTNVVIAWSEEGRNWFAATDATETAVAAFRAANREGEIR